MSQTDVAVRGKAFILVLIVAAIAIGLAYAIREKDARDLAVLTSRIH